MGQGITVDISARVTGYEASLKLLLTAMAKLDPGADISKNLTKAFKDAESLVKALSKNMFPKATSDSLIDSIIEKTNRAGEAILRVAQLMRSVNPGDLNLSALGSDFESLRTLIVTLENELEGKLNAGILRVVEDSSLLKGIFSELGVDLGKADAVTLFEEISKASLKATAEVEKTEEALAKIGNEKTDLMLKNTSLGQKRLGSIEGKDALGSELNNIVNQYNNVFEQLRNTMTTGMAKIKFDSGTSSKKILDEFFKDLTPLNLEKHIKDLVLNIQNSSNLDLKTEIYKTVFGDNYNTTNINTLVKSIGLDLAYDLYKAAFLEFFRNIFNDISFKDLAKISSLVNNNDLDGAVKATTLALDNAYVEISKNIQKNKEQLAALLTDEQGVMLQLNTAKLALQTYSSAEADLRNLIELLRDLNKLLINQIEQLKAERNTKVGAAAGDVRKAGDTALHDVSGQLFEGTEAALKYRAALEQVTARELMVGKILGVVLRWFSIYAAIRMVGNAIRSVISTVKELDSTITEIAIVTKMDQSDLWGQMGKYTELARNYAASISGVYKVSLLYYQQGLLSADVMALTELTLKMARISGLDYAEATDYMTNAIRSFKMEMTDALNVVDVYSAIAASSATSVTELATAMSKTASSAQAVGASFENTTAMMAVMIEATRESPENIGSAMKSIISRYGELKEKKTGTDAEGEEYSLNKVDTALLSVGLSIHDVNGEFRNFDDVIMELASKWDTIDKNTLRYIATVMAGNRQQSRFLALVSSYDRLKELSAEAANSEDASLLQFLKTLDSVEAKTQLILTSLLSLYTSSGVETLYKTLLDIGNRVVKTFADISNKGDWATMIGKIGATFTNLAVLVTNVFNFIKTRVAITKSEMLSKALEAAAKEMETADESADGLIRAEQRVTEALAEEELKRHLLRLQEMTDALTAAQRRAKTEEEKTRLNYRKLLKEQLKTRTYGMVASALGTAATGIAANMDINTLRGGKAALTGIGSLLSGIGTGMMIGGPAGAIMGTITALPGIIEAIGMTIESVDEKVAKFKDNITKANNKKIVAKDELTTLKAYKDQLAELESHLYDSVESKKEYLALSNEIASSYPLLISYIDEEGNKIVQLGSAYDNLVKSKENAFRQELIKTGNARINAVSDANTALSLLGIDFEALKDSGSTFKSILATLGEYAPEGFVGLGLTHWALNWGLQNTIGWLIPTAPRILASLLGAGDNGLIDLSSSAYNSIVPQLADTSFENLNYGKDSAILQYKRSDVLLALYGEHEFSGLYVNALEELKEINSEAYNKYKGKRFIENGYDATTESVLPMLGAIVDTLLEDGKDEKDINEILAKIDSGLKINSEALLYRKDAIKSTLEKYRDKLIEAENLELFSTAFAEQGTIAGTSYQLPYMQYQFLKLWEEYINPDNEDYEKNVVKNDKGGIDYALTWSKFSLYYEEFYLKALKAYKTMIQTAGDNTLDELESMMAEPTVYSANDWLDLLDIIGEESDIGQFIKKYILDNITDTMKNYKEAFRNLGTRANINLDTESGIISFIDNIGTLYIPNILSLYETILKNKSLSTSQKQALIAGLDNIYKIASDITDKTIQKSVLNNLQKADFTSLKGIFDVLKVLGNIKGLDLDKSGLLDAINGFKDTLLVNLTTEFESLFKEYTEGITEFEKTLSSASKGMDYATAAKLADTLGVTLSDFRFTAGKYYYDTIKDIEDYYIKITEELKQELEKKRDQLKVDLLRLLNDNIAGAQFSLFKDGKMSPSMSLQEVVPLKELIEDSSLAITEESLKPYSPIFAEHGIKISDIVEKALEYRKLIVNHELDANTQFEEWLLSVVDELYLTQYDAVIRESDTYLKDLTARALLSSGNISGFLDTTLGKITSLYEAHTTEYYKDLAKKDLGRGATYELIMTRAKEIADTENAAAAAEAQKVAEDERKLLIDAIAGGEVDNLPDQLKSFAKLIYDTYHATASGILTSVTAAMKGGINQIFVDEKNILMLLSMKDAGKYLEIKEGEENIPLEIGDVVHFAEGVIEGTTSLNNWIVDTYKSEEERLKALQDYHAVLNTLFTDASNLMSKESIVGFNDLTSYFSKYNDQITASTMFDEEGEYSDVFKTQLELYGLEINNLTGDFVIKNLEKYLTLLLEDLSLLISAGATTELKNDIQKRIVDAKNNITKNQVESSKKLLLNYKSFSTEELESFANAFKLDFNAVKNLLAIDNLDGTFKLNIAVFLHKLTQLGDKVTEEMSDMINTLVGEIADDYSESITTAVNYTTKGTTKLSDILKFLKSYKEVTGESIVLADAFNYTDIFDAWTLSPEILIKYATALAQELVNLGLLSTKEVDQYVNDNVLKKLVEAIDIQAFLDNKSDRSRKKLSLLMKTAGIKLSAESENWEDYLTDEIRQEAIKNDMSTEELAKIYAAKAKENNEDVDHIISILEQGGSAAVDIVKAIADENDVDLKASDIEAAYRALIKGLEESLDLIISSPGTIISGVAVTILETLQELGKASIAKLGDGSSAVVTSITDIAAAYEEYYNLLAESGEATLAALNEAKAKVLETKNGRDTELAAIDALGNASGMTYSAFAEIFTNAGIKLTDNIISQLERDSVIQAMGGNKMRIKDFTKFALAMGWKSNSEEYLSAFKAYNDGLIELNRKTERDITAEITSLKSAKPGDWINMTDFSHTLSKIITNTIKDVDEKGNRILIKTTALDDLNKLLQVYGAYISDGILKLTDKANLLGVAEAIQAAALNAKGEITDGLEEIADAVTEILKGYADAIKKGIEGGLTNVEKKDLVSKALDLGITKIDFTEAANGAKLAEQSAIALYAALKRVDAAAASLTFDSLKTSLEAANENFKTVSSLTSYLSNTIALINDADKMVSDARLSLYQAELEVAKDILAVRSTQEDNSFNFMSNDIPAALNNPLNYAKNWTQALLTLRDAWDTSKVKKNGKAGFIDYKDYYNIITEMNNIAGISGLLITIGHDINGDALELDGSLEAASKAIQAGCDSLTTVDTGDLKVNLGAIGLNIELGAASMQDSVTTGILAAAKSLVKMLDGLIAMLEIIVAMELLGDITGDDMQIDLGDIFMVGDKAAVESNLKDITSYTDKFDKARDKLLTYLNKNTEARDMFKNTKLSFGGELRSMYEMLSSSFDELWGSGDKAIPLEYRELAAKSFQGLLNSFYQAAISGDYNLNDIATSVKNIMLQTGVDLSNFVFEFTDDKGTVTRVITFVGETVVDIDFTNENLRKNFDKYFNTKFEQDEAGYRTRILGLLEEYQKGKEKNTLTQEREIEIRTELGVAANEFVLKETDGVYSGYYDGKHFKGEDSEKLLSMMAEAALFKDQGFDFEVTMEEKTDYATGIKGKTTIGGVEIEVALKDRKPQYTYTDSDGNPHTSFNPESLIGYIANDGKLDEINAGTYSFEKDNEKFNIEVREHAELGMKYSITTGEDGKPIFKYRNLKFNEYQDMYEYMGLMKAYDATGSKSSIEDITLDGKKAKQNTITVNEAAKAKVIIKFNEDGFVENTAYEIDGQSIAGDNAKGVFDAITTVLDKEGAFLLDNPSFTAGNTVKAAYYHMGLRVDVSVEVDTGTVTYSWKPDGSKDTDIPPISGNDPTLVEAAIVAYNGLLDTTQEKNVKMKISTGVDVTYVVKNGKVEIQNKSGLTQEEQEEAEKILEKLNALYGKLTLENPIEAQASKVTISIGEDAEITTDALTLEIKEPIPEATGTVTTLKVKAENTEAEGAITNAEIAAMLNDATVNVSIDKDTAIEDLNLIETKAKEVGDLKPKVKVTGDNKDALDKFKKVTSEAESVGKLKPTVNIKAEDNATSIIDSVQDAINNLLGKTVYINVEETVSEAIGNLGLSKGTVGLALASGTLMGELGPELVVLNGRYFVAGLNGAEFVDLKSDAIVFNHLLTELLLKNGMSSTRGKAVTNERVATAYAKGNVNGGPAMASAAAALAALKQLRAQWQALASLSAQDLAGAGGSGGGGGGGGDPKAFVKELEKWYDWLQQIALLEKEITLEEAKRAKYQSDMVVRGKEYFTSLKQSLDLLQEQITVLKSLFDSQEKYFDERRAELNKQSAFSSLYTFGDSGQLYYNKETYRNGMTALEWLSDLAGRNTTTGEANYTAEEQYNRLVDAGFGFAMKYDSSGNEIKQEGEDWYSTAVQAFWDKIEADKQEMLTLHDSIEDAEKKIYELESKLNEILKEIEDNLITVELKVLKAVEESRLREIDELEKQRSAIEKSAKDMIDGLSDLLNKEKELYNLLNLADELSKLQRQLSILLRSGGSLAQIADLLKLIADKQLNLYFDTLLKQIDALQEASDNELERLDHLITIMKETLDYLKENGLLWNAVYELLLKSPADISAFILTNTKEYWGQSPTELAKTIREDLFEIERFKELQASVEKGVNILGTVYGDEIAEKEAEERKKKEEEEAARKAEEDKKKKLQLQLSSSGSKNNLANKKTLAPQTKYDFLEPAIKDVTKKLSDSVKNSTEKLTPVGAITNGKSNITLDGAKIIGSTALLNAQKESNKNISSPLNSDAMDRLGTIVNKSLLSANGSAANNTKTKTQDTQNYAALLLENASKTLGNTSTNNIGSILNKSLELIETNTTDRVDVTKEAMADLEEMAKLMGVSAASLGEINKETGLVTWRDGALEAMNAVFGRDPVTGKPNSTIQFEAASEVILQTNQSAVNDLNNNTKAAIQNIEEVFKETLATNPILSKDIATGYIELNKKGSIIGATTNKNEAEGMAHITSGSYGTLYGADSLGKINAITREEIANSALNTLQAIRQLSEYATGGVNDKTGLAMLHGTKTKPEAVLNAEQTRVLRNNILSNRPDSLISLLRSYNEAYQGLSASTYDSISNNSNATIIEHAEVNLNIEKLANDYDSKRAANTVMTEMLRIASKTSANNSVRR